MHPARALRLLASIMMSAMLVFGGIAASDGGAAAHQPPVEAAALDVHQGSHAEGEDCPHQASSGLQCCSAIHCIWAAIAAVPALLPATAGRDQAAYVPHALVFIPVRRLDRPPKA